MLIKIKKLEVHKTCDKIGITPPKIGNRNGPDLVQAFQKKWWVESRFYSALNLPLPFGFPTSNVYFIFAKVQSHSTMKISKIRMESV